MQPYLRITSQHEGTRQPKLLRSLVDTSIVRPLYSSNFKRRNHHLLLQWGKRRGTMYYVFWRQSVPMWLSYYSRQGPLDINLVSIYKYWLLCNSLLRFCHISLLNTIRLLSLSFSYCYESKIMCLWIRIYTLCY